MAENLPFISYPSIERHGVIGDRRTAALIAADGTADWLCLPNYDGLAVFGSLLDAGKGGFWRWGPAIPALGQQRYLEGSSALVTAWDVPGGRLDVTDVMLRPEDDRSDPARDRRVIVRRLRCPDGQVNCSMVLSPRSDFETPADIVPTRNGWILTAGGLRLGLWTSFAVQRNGSALAADLRLNHGQEHWALLGLNEKPDDFSRTAVQEAFEQAVRYWQQRPMDDLSFAGPREPRVRRSILLVHLLDYGPTGALTAAVTNSLPERIGGDRNYDYRYSWVRDTSLALGVISLLGPTHLAQRYIDWLAHLESSTDSPLQVVYRVDGGTDLTQRDRWDLAGFRGSRPVRIGNWAFHRRQLDSLGYLADCALIYLEQGGSWRPEYWQMMRRIADYTAGNWHKPGSGIWELPIERHYVSGKVMSWTVMDRVVRIAEETGHGHEADAWRVVQDQIHDEVMSRGWSDSLNAFRQHYDDDSLDASTLLIPIMRFLPADHPRVRATVDRIMENLTINGFVHRFDPRPTLGRENLPLGRFEGAFLPCTFWLAAALAMDGRTEEAEALLRRAEAVAGELGLFAEEVDAVAGTFLGNTPQLFSQVEYVRAVLALAEAQGRISQHGHALAANRAD